MRRAVPFAVVLLCVLLLPNAGVAVAAQLAEAEIALAEGLAALHGGHEEEAADWFAEAARLNPDEGSARYWRGLALLRLGRSGEAAEELAASLEARHPSDVARERVLADLEAARRGGPAGAELPESVPAPKVIDDRGIWEGIAGLSAAADSNPNLFSEELILPLPGGQELIRGEEADRKTRVHLRLGVYPFHTHPGPNLGVTLQARWSFHQDFGFLDLGQLRGTVQLAFGSDPLGYLKGPLGHTRVPFGTSRFSALLQAGGTAWQIDEASYLRAWEGAASLTFQEAPITATRLDLGYSDRNFSKGGLADDRRSGEDLSLQASQLFFFGQRDRYVRIGALAVDRQAHRAFSESILEGNAELSLPVALRWTVHLEGSVREDDFDHPESNLFVSGGPVRNDTTTRAALTLIWAATERLRWTARGTYVDRSSNVDLGDGLPDLDYQRTIVSVGLGWVF
jgi:hypothetical protein